MSLTDILEKGGVLMYPILLASVVAIVAFLERLWSLQRRFVVPQGFVRALRNLLQRSELGTAETLCAENGSAFANVAASAIRHRAGGRAGMKEAMEETGQLETARMARFIGITGTVATISPLLGLLGTVTGMIKVFRDVAEQADPQISVLARGIWEALLTTGAGLTVAIPAYLGYRYLLSRVDLLATEMEEEALELLDAVISQDGLLPAASTASGAEASGGTDEQAEAGVAEANGEGALS